MNVWDILILLAVAGIAGFSFFRVRNRKAEGKSCCGNCSLCNASCATRPDQKS